MAIHHCFCSHVYCTSHMFYVKCCIKDNCYVSLIRHWAIAARTKYVLFCLQLCLWFRPVLWRLLLRLRHRPTDRSGSNHGSVEMRRSRWGGLLPERHGRIHDRVLAALFIPYKNTTNIYVIALNGKDSGIHCSYVLWTRYSTKTWKRGREILYL